MASILSILHNILENQPSDLKQFYLDGVMIVLHIPNHKVDVYICQISPLVAQYDRLLEILFNPSLK